MSQPDSTNLGSHLGSHLSHSLIDDRLDPVTDNAVDLADDAPLTADAQGPIQLVSLTRLMAEGPGKCPVGVRLQPGDDARQLRDRIHALALVVITFPRFGDGRGYSQARILRDELGYTGPLRAVGDVLFDQLYAMRRCGFDQFDVKPGKLSADAPNPFQTFSHTYQPASDPRPSSGS